MNTHEPSRSTLPICKTWRMLLALVALTALLPVVRGARVDRYVDSNNASPAWPYGAWTNAATDIQTAVDAAVATEGDQVIVRAGVYATGGTVAPDRMLTNRVYLSKAITVRSEDNDPATTIIRGAWDPVKTNGPAAVRCVYMVNDASLIGFTLTNGATITTDERPANLIFSDASGGGVWAASASATISNCVISGNTASQDHWNGYSGGGAFQGAYFNCTLSGNSADYAGGAQRATLYDCTLSGNSANTGVGGATRDCTLYGCIVSNNSATAQGGGLYQGAAYDSTLVGNTGGGEGGGAYGGTHSNCHIALNVSNRRGGGASRATLFNCQVVSNQCLSGDQWGGGAYLGVHSNSVFAYNVSYNGGGARGGSFYNCLIYGNEARDGGGTQESTLMNCTVVGNYGSANGGGVASWDLAGRSVVNSIIYGNKAGGSRDNCGGYLTLSNSCYTTNVGYPLLGAVMDSTTSHPLLMDMGSGYGTNHVAGNYRLRGTSPCLNTGLMLEWMDAAADLDGNPRIDKVTGKVDMGCYERIYTGTVLLVR